LLILWSDPIKAYSGLPALNTAGELRFITGALRLIAAREFIFMFVALIFKISIPEIETDPVNESIAIESSPVSS
jgi:hypothetical protein